MYSRYVVNFPAALIKLEKLKHSSKNFDGFIKVFVCGLPSLYCLY